MTKLKAALIATAVATAVLTQSAAHAQSAAPVLEPATQHFIDTLAASKAPPIYTLSPADARNVLAGAQAQPVKKQVAKIEDRVIQAGPTGKIALRIVRPEHANGPLPVVMYFHGGGWVLGDKNTHDRLVREIANGAQAEVVFVDYDRSPETKYPVPIEQAYAATRYVADHAREFNVDASRMAVAGDSVGGNMVAAVTLLAKERGGPKLRAQVLFYPVTDANFDDASYNQFANGPWLTRDAMKWFWDAYAPNAADREKITASPLRASLDELKGLPPALVITDENDVLRDEGEAYARKLTQAGVPVTSARYNGTIHDFVMLNALAETPATRAAIAQANATLKAALKK
ncbi:alpha/beta hydrolase [Caballeronia novacaledonica]|uniref:Alpha/beta hydrolase n=1 Tax=Caballeronia novacaledonica TaxID=1544861 RepID=A0A2U3I4N3_9BURK|nr:alpha/beta hydrolase [Caballeronia novacaledonica]SPB15107.1 alpha/beta hydrolase [Caballeronia novacaledonica]